jgi:hypothetical protein
MGEMERLADLRNALYPRQGPSEELRARVLAEVSGGARVPARNRRTSGRAWWPLPSLAAAAVVVAVVVLGGALFGAAPDGDGRPSAPVQTVAFAVRVNADGSVTFTAHDLVDASAATRALNDAGIAGKVLNSTEGCTSGPGHDGQPNPADFYPPDTLHSKYPNFQGSATVILRASDYPPAGGLLVVVGPVARPKSETGDAVGLGVWAYADAGKIPDCVGPGTGP